MAEEKIQFTIAADDKMSAVADKAFKKVEDRAKQAGEVAETPIRFKDDPDTSGVIPFAPAKRIVERSNREQVIRDQTAGRIRAMRDQAQRASIRDEVTRRLYGDPVSAAAEGDTQSTSRGRQVAERSYSSTPRDRGDIFSSLKGAAGQGSMLGGLASILKGGGAIIGVAAGVEIVRKLGAGLSEIGRVQSTEGLDPAEKRWRTIKAIPGIGQFAGAIESVRDGYSEVVNSDFHAQERRREELKQKNKDRAEDRNRRLAELSPIEMDADRRSQDAKLSRSEIEAGGKRRGLSPEARARAELEDSRRFTKERAKLEFDRANTDTSAAEQEKLRGVANPELQAKIREAFNRQRITLDAEYKNKLLAADTDFANATADIEKDRSRRIEDITKSSAESRIRTAEDIEVRSLRLKKLEYDAEEKELEQSYARQKRSRIQAFDQATRDLEKGSAEYRARQKELADQLAGDEADKSSATALLKATNTRQRRDETASAARDLLGLLAPSARAGDISRGTAGGEDRLGGGRFTAQDTFIPKQNSQDKEIIKLQEIMKNDLVARIRELTDVLTRNGIRLNVKPV